MEGEGKEFAAYFEDDNLLRLQVSCSHSPTMDTELFRVISPLHTQPTDAASETELPNSVKAQGSLNMGAKSMVSDTEALGVGEGRKIPVMLKRRPCRLQTADCRLCRPCRLCRLSVIFLYLYLNFLVKFLL